MSSLSFLKLSNDSASKVSPRAADCVTVWVRSSFDTHVVVVKKVKVVFLYSAVSSPLDLFTLFALPGRPVHSDTNSAFPGSILVMQQLRANTKSLTFPPLSIARYSFIQLSQLGRQWREQNSLSSLAICVVAIETVDLHHIAVLSLSRRVVT